MGKEGLRELAQLNMAQAAYARQRLTAIPGVRLMDPGPWLNEFSLELPMDARMAVSRLIHEVVMSAADTAARQGITAVDVAKALIDFGFHPPTVYFPLVVKEAIMIEPIEIESKGNLDAFVEAMRS